MRFLAVDWGTSRLRALLVADGTVLDRAESPDGIGRLPAGDHRAAFARVAGRFLAAEPDLPVVLAGMVGSREGWFPAPYADCPAGAAEIASVAIEANLGNGRVGLVVPGLRLDGPDGVDVMRGEETHLLGSGVRDGLVCLPGTHCKWAVMTDGRVTRFATFMTGEMHALLREHSMIGRPAIDPPDPAGFRLGLEAGQDGALLRTLFGARAATVTGRLAPAALGPYLSGLLMAAETRDALRLFGRPECVTVVADPDRAALYAVALGRERVATEVVAPERTLVAGLSRILAARGLT